MQPTLFLPLTIVLLTGHAFAADPPMMEARGKLESGEVAAFDAAMDKTYAKDGSGVMARVIAAEAAEKGSGNTEMAKLYAEGKLTQAGAEAIKWDKVAKEQRKTAVLNLAAKETIDMGDLKLIQRLALVERCPELAPRREEILALMPKTAIGRYRIASQLFNPGHAGSWVAYMKDQEILDVLGGVLNAQRYDAFRKEMLARCVGAVTRTRRAAGLPNDSTSFDAAMAPILTALNAPLWEGLPAAVAPYGMTLTVPDYTGLVEDLTKRCKDLEERRISDASNFAGSLMFWKGVEGYKSWAQDMEN